jgi:hypothetical protein
MAGTSRRLSMQAFDRLREQLATASVLCADDQLLELADGLHESLRRRRNIRHSRAPLEERSFSAP